MPQELHVLRCYSCKMYQVHIVKKANKWQCKICNEKQSIQITYFRGSGSECRNYVQSQNARSIISMEQAKDVYVAVVDGWGLDCDAEADDNCNCSRKKSTIATTSRLLMNKDRDRKSENFVLSGNFPKRRKVDLQQRRTRSLPSRKNVQCEGASSKSNSFPCSSERQKSFGKWETFLEDSDDAKDSEEEKENKVVKKSSESDLENFLSSRDTDDSSDEYAVTFSAKDFDSIKRCRNDPEDREDATFIKLKSSQVDDSSDASSVVFQGVVSNLFQDLNDDLDLELDF